MNNYVNSALRTLMGSYLRYESLLLSEVTNNYYYPNAVSDNKDIDEPIENLTNLTLNDAGPPFKGIYLPEDMAVEIIGVDGKKSIFSLTQGHWPFGGIGIHIPGTSAVSDAIVFLY